MRDFRRLLRCRSRRSSGLLHVVGWHLVTNFSGQKKNLFLDCLHLWDGADRLSRNVVNYQPTVHNILEEWRPQLYPGFDKLVSDLTLAYSSSSGRFRESSLVEPVPIAFWAKTGPHVNSCYFKYFICPTNAHTNYFKIIKLLKTFENYNTCSNMLRFT